MKGIKDKETGRFVKNLCDKLCLTCSATFHPRTAKIKYCSNSCMGKAYQKDRAKDCETCHEEFQAFPIKNRFCSHACYSKSLVTGGVMVKKMCPSCFKIFSVRDWSVQKYCTKACFRQGLDRKEEVSCELCNSVFLVNKARIKTVRFCSKVCQGKFFNGEKSCHYKKDRSSLKTYGDDLKDRRSPRYIAWRKEVWLRDNFKCRIGNKGCDGRIEAHHILGWSEYVELRYEVNNGITLCHAHHPRKRAEEKRLAPAFMELVSASKKLF